VALAGDWASEDGGLTFEVMTSAKAFEVIGFTSEAGLLVPKLKSINGEVSFRRERNSKETICELPRIPDPLELVTVKVDSSNISNAGEGLFCTRFVA